LPEIFFKKFLDSDVTLWFMILQEGAEMKEYSIKELAELAHTTDRALRYYEECGLLSPRRNTESNYRIYTQEDVDCLQQILIYRSLDFSIAEIKRMLNDKNYDAVRALNEQKEK
jgi:DNA-binding transcriptional MerR regulator